MYDDQGIKTPINPINDSYHINDIELISSIKNRLNKKQNQQSKQSKNKKSKFDQLIDNDAINEYKKMANLHIEEEVFHVYEIIDNKLITTLFTDTIYKCWQILDENDLKQIPMVDLNGKIKGLATISNIAKAMVENLEDSHYIKHTSINEIAVHDIVTAEPISDIRRVAQVMVKYHLNTIPITKDDGIVIGMLSRADILKVVASQPHFALLA